MNYILDTDHLGILQRHAAPEHSTLMGRILEHSADSFYTTIISFHEQLNGWNAFINSATDPARVMRGYRMFQEILREFTIAQLLPFDEGANDKFAELRGAGVRIGTMDLRIASIALAHDCTVLTRNLRDFAQVTGLRVEDWTTLAQR